MLLLCAYLLALHRIRQSPDEDEEEEEEPRTRPPPTAVRGRMWGACAGREQVTHKRVVLTFPRGPRAGPRIPTLPRRAEAES
jgi:hypothetical protein